MASALDDSTERIVTYLAETWDVPINAIFFRVFRNDEHEFLTRAWFRDPTGGVETKDAPAKSGNWNGEYYASFGVSYDWDQAQKYGYISAGGKLWYSQTLLHLEPERRIWVYSPGNGYIGVGIVAGPRQTAREFLVTQKDGTQLLLASLDTVDPEVMAGIDEPGKENYVVPVRWIKTIPISQAIKETGFFSNQNSACMPKTDKWVHTVERLKKRFGVE